jgi:hypothetical protein
MRLWSTIWATAAAGPHEPSGRANGGRCRRRVLVASTRRPRSSARRRTECLSRKCRYSRSGGCRPVGGGDRGRAPSRCHRIRCIALRSGGSRCGVWRSGENHVVDAPCDCPIPDRGRPSDRYRSHSRSSATKLVRREDLTRMKTAVVLVDVSIDQGARATSAHRRRRLHLRNWAWNKAIFAAVSRPRCTGHLFW